MNSVSISGLVAATPVAAVDRIVTATASLAPAQWAVVALAALTLVLWGASRRLARRPETLNQRSAREVEEARR